MQRTRLFVSKKRHRNTPLTLPRQRPVGPVGDHCMKPRLTPGRKKLGLLNAGYSQLSQRRTAVCGLDIHSRKPLVCCTINNGALVSPAVHIAVGVALRMHKAA